MHETEKKGLLKVQEIVVKLGWIFRPTPNDDYGIDGEIEPVVNGSPTNRLLKVQIRSGASYVQRETAQSFDYVASSDDLDYWVRCNVPVLLIVYDPRRDQAYWRWVQGNLRDQPDLTTTKRLSFDRTRDMFSERHGEALVRISGDTSAVADADPPVQPPHSECMMSNLLKVTELPRQIFSVRTACKSTGEVRTLLGDRPKSPFILREKRILTFSNLLTQDHPLLVAASEKQIQQEERATWESTPDKLRWLVELMNATLRKKCAHLGLEFDRDRSRYYFRPRDGKLTRINYQAFTRRITRKVAYPYPETNPSFWVHHGAKFRFLRFGAHWFLMIEPIFVFTKDGTQLLAGERVGKLSTKRQAKEYNQSVMNHLIFWREILSECEKVIRVYPAVGDQAFIVSKVFADGLADFGIAEDFRPLHQLEEASEFEVVLDEDRDSEPEEVAEEEPRHDEADPDQDATQ